MSYKKITDLVEEVREILEAVPQEKKKTLKKKFKSTTKHSPFKNLKKGKHLGGTSKAVATKRGPSTTTPGTKRGKWRCRCHQYDCHCVGKNDEGETIEKHVRIDKAYKAKYNAAYRRWRKKNAKKFAPGKTSRFKSPAKPHHKRYHAD